MKKNNTWNIRRLVDESFVPLAQPTSVLYCKLTDFKSGDQTILNGPDLGFSLGRAILLFTTIFLVVSLGTNFLRGFC